MAGRTFSTHAWSRSLATARTSAVTPSSSRHSRSWASLAPTKLTRAASSRPPASSWARVSASWARPIAADSSDAALTSTLRWAQRTTSSGSNRVVTLPSSATSTSTQPFGPGLPGVAALDVAGEDDVRILGDHAVCVDVAEGPVVIALRLQVVDAARRVSGVVGVPGERGVQQAHVEDAGNALRIGGGQVLGDVAGHEPLAVHDQVQPLAVLGVRRGLAELDDAGQLQLPGDLAGGVVVARDEVDLDPGREQRRHLRPEEQPRVVVGPVAVEDVAGQQDRVDPLLLRQRDHVRQCAPGGRPDRFDRCTRVGGQAAQRTVHVKVRGVQQAHSVYLARSGSWEPPD